MPSWSRIVATAALCCALSAAVVQVPISRAVVTFPARKGAGSVVVFRTVEVAIGTPAQHFNLTVDFASNYAQVFDENFSVFPAQCTPKSENRRRFNSSESSSYQRNAYNFSADIYEDYFQGCVDDVEPARDGVVARDVVAIGGLAAKVNFGVVLKDEYGSPQPYWPSDGLLGFEPLYPGKASKESTLYDLARAAGAAQVTIFGGAEPNGPGSAVLTLGGPDAANCASSWTRFAIVRQWNDREWNLRVNKVQFGGYSQTVPDDVDPWYTVVGARAKTSVPPKVFKQIVKTLGAEYDFASDEYLVDCDATKSAPAIVLQVASYDGSRLYEYRIPSSAFAANLTKRKDKKCILLFDETDPKFWTDWQLGWNALAGYCWMFDYHEGQFAYAKTKH